VLVPVNHSSADPAELAALAHNICPLAACKTYPDLVIALEAAATAAQNLIVLWFAVFSRSFFGGQARLRRSSSEDKPCGLNEALCVWAAGKDYFSGVSFVWL